jgi:hypothetical protein
MDRLLAAIRLLFALTGRLRASAGSTESQLKLVRELIAHCFFLDQAEAFFSVSDPLQLVDLDELDTAEFSELRDLCASVQAGLENQPGQALEYRVFRRQIPVMGELPEALPRWAAGAATRRSFGPFIDPDHRPVWFTVYKTSPYVALLSIGGDPIVFLPFIAGLEQPATEFVFPAGSVWISARLLAPEAPARSYCGLRVTSANLQLDTLGTIEAIAIVIQSGTQLRLDLELDPSQHRIDATQGALHPGRIRANYPTSVHLVGSSSGLQIEGISTAELSVFGTDVGLRWQPGISPAYDKQSNRILVPYAPDAANLNIEARSSHFHISGVAEVRGAAWALRVAQPYLEEGPYRPPTLGEAAGVGELALTLDPGLQAEWTDLSEPIRLRATQLLFESTGSTLYATATNDAGGSHRFGLWPDARAPRHRCSLQLDYRGEFSVSFRLETDTSEALACDSVETTPPERSRGETLCLLRLDRPVLADGTRLTGGPVKCRSIFLHGPNTDPGLLVIHLAPSGPSAVSDRSRRYFALENALLKATSFLALFVFGSIDSAADRLKRGVVSLHFGIGSIVPILPDPYTGNFAPPGQGPIQENAARLSSRTRWADPDSTPEFTLWLAPFYEEDPAFPGLFPSALTPNPPTPQPPIDTEVQNEDNEREKSLRQIFDNSIKGAPEPLLYLLDLSSNADQFGIGLGFPAGEGLQSRTVIRRRSIVTLARDLRIFAVPQIQWEPVWTIQNATLPAFPSPLISRDDGGATLLGIDTVNLVPIDPAQAVRGLVNEFERRDPSITAAALFTLPFGMKAVAAPLYDPGPEEPLARGAALDLVQPRKSGNEVSGALQISLTAVDPLSAVDRESPGFSGATIQLRNCIDSSAGKRLSVLADKQANSVQNIFNSEFGPGSARARVPISRIDFSGYGASLYSRWQNPAASTAATSQVYFDVAVGRTAHEVVQVRSVLYPWGVRVVRTITIERAASGGVFRRDSGWVAISDGVFDFPAGSQIETHPGVVKGVFNVRRIRDTTHTFQRAVGGSGIRMTAVRFDADVRISDVVVGASNGLVPSIDQIGFVQIEGTSLTPGQYAALLDAEGPLGGPVDCIIDIGGSGQRMRVTRVDVAAARRPPNPVEFAAAARGSLLLPNAGQWSAARQSVGVSAECVAADPHSGVPLIRHGYRNISDAVNSAPYRFAEPGDLFVPGLSGTYLALLWSMGTQRVLFPQPHIVKDTRAIRGAAKPLLADPFAINATSAVFPAPFACLEIPFPNYSLDIVGESQLRLTMPSATFPARRVSNEPRRELSRGASIRTFVDYTDTRFTLRLDSRAPQTWTYEQTGVAIIQERDRVHVRTSHGIFRASSTEAVRWILTREEFGDLFAEAKTLLPLLRTGISGPGTFPTGGGIVIPDTAMPPLTIAEGPNPKIGFRIEKEIPDKVPVFIGVTLGGSVEIIFLFEEFFSLEVVVGILVAGIFPAGGLLKFESETLRHPRSNVSARDKLEFVLAIGIQVEGEFQALVPFPHRYNWKIFLGIGFAVETGQGVGVGIIFQASGTVQYPGEVSLVEVGVNVEGQGLLSFDNGDTFIVCKGSLSIEITVAFLLDIEWEITEGEIYKQKI